jgi:hypothetical protein
METIDIVAAILAQPYLGPAGRNQPSDAVKLFREIRQELREQLRKHPDIEVEE